MKQPRVGSWFLTALCLLGCEPASIDALTDLNVPSLPQHTTTKFIHWGGGQPTGPDELAWFVDHLAEVEASPFDGTVLDLGVGTSWFDSDLTEATFAASAALLEAAPFASFTENFQRLQFGTLSFADDAAWERIGQNLTLLAGVIRQAGLRGFMFDTQAYADYHFSYARLPDGKLSFAAEGTRFFGRGKQLMGALLTGYPELTLLTTLGTSEVFREVCIGGTRLEDSDYALLPAFLDGMSAARDEAQSGAVLSDGFLAAYATRDPASFRLYHDLVHGDWEAMQAHWFPGVVTYRWAPMQSDQSLGESHWPDAPVLLCSDADRRLLTRDFPASFAVMLDYPNWDTGTDGFQIDPARFSDNLHEPAEYTALLRSALQAADRYAWSWTSELLWWPKAGDARPLVPQEYLAAARLALEQARNPEAARP